MENPGHGKLLVFIGDKIEVEELTDEKDIMDLKFVARYKILEKVCGDYKKDTVQFIVYDHYGRPAFERHRTVMLYLREVEGKYYHQKYQYHDVYKTKDGRWASPYDWQDYARADTLNNPIKPDRIDFAEKVSFSIKGLKTREIRERFPTPFYKVVDTIAIAVYGNYAPELFELKKRGVLGARGLFGTEATIGKVEPLPLTLLHEIILSKDKGKQLTTVWKELYNGLVTQQVDKIREMSMDTVFCSPCEGFSTPDFYNDKVPIDSFIAASNRNLPGTELWQLLNTGKFRLGGYQQSSNGQLVSYVVKFTNFANFNDNRYELYHNFEFLNVDGKLKFNGIRSGWSSREEDKR